MAILIGLYGAMFGILAYWRGSVNLQGNFEKRFNVSKNIKNILCQSDKVDIAAANVCGTCGTYVHDAQ